MGAWKIERFEEYFYFMVDQLFPFNLVVTDTVMRIVNKFFPFEEVGENFVILAQPLRKTLSGVQFHRYLDDRVYEVKGMSDVSIPYEMDFGKTKMNFPKIKGYPRDVCKAKLKKSRGNVDFFVQNTGYAIATYWNKLEAAVTIYNKKSRKSSSCYSKKFYDKYAGFDVWFTYTTDHDEFVAIVTAEELLRNFAATTNVEDRKYIENLGVTEDSNPLLYVVRTK
jgi:hypothetical protein